MLERKTGDVLLLHCVVDEVDAGDTRWPYHVIIGEEGVWVGESDVERALRTPLQQNDNPSIQVGDIVQLHSGKMNVVTGFEEDDKVLCDLGWFYLKDVVAVYGKSWEKPKTLEEMSKEELIAIVEKLRGEAK